MDVTDLTPHLDGLESDLDDLEEALAPLLEDLGEASSRLPLLDKAKLNVLATYALESLLFCSLRLNGVETRNHAIFQELTRVKQYFEKVKKIEEPPARPSTSVDKQAAIRFIRSDLADNAQVKEKLSEMLQKERAKAEAALVPGDEKRLDDNAAPNGDSETKNGTAERKQRAKKSWTHKNSKAGT